MRDLWLFTEVGEGSLDLGFGDKPRACEGVELLVSMVVHTFLTELGSDLLDKNLGTSIGNSVGGNIYFGTPIFKSVALNSLRQTVDLIKSDQDTLTPDDEFLESLQLIDYNLVGDSMFIDIAINSRAGLSRVIKVPVETVI